MALVQKAYELGANQPIILEANQPNLMNQVNVLQNGVLEMRQNTEFAIAVEGGGLGSALILDPSIAKIGPSSLPGARGNRLSLSEDREYLTIYSGTALGKTTLTVSTLGGLPVSIEIWVGPRFVEGVNHNHQPSGRWKDVQANPNNGSGLVGSGLAALCPTRTPLELVKWAKTLAFGGKPIALQHLDWYLKDGKGADFVEDSNISDWLRRDSGIRSRLKSEISPRRIRRGYFEFTQGEFKVDDFQYAFGSIDRVDFQVDFGRDIVQVWFKDRYEWHPVYPFYSLLPGDAPPRETNCLHAAFVELKTSGAADFWMKGEAEVKLSTL